MANYYEQCNCGAYCDEAPCERCSKAKAANSDPSERNCNLGIPNLYRLLIRYQGDSQWYEGQYTYHGAIELANRIITSSSMIDIYNDEGEIVLRLPVQHTNYKTCNVCNNTGRAMNKEAQLEHCIWCKGPYRKTP